MFKALYRLGVKLSMKLRLYETRINRYLKIIEPYVNDADTVLDLGSGRGDFTKKLCGKVKQVIALDINCKALRNINEPFAEKFAQTHKTYH